MVNRSDMNASVLSANSKAVCRLSEVTTPPPTVAEKLSKSGTKAKSKTGLMVLLALVRVRWKLNAVRLLRAIEARLPLYENPPTPVAVVPVKSVGAAYVNVTTPA